jgi:hypothetical protein
MRRKRETQQFSKNTKMVKIKSKRTNGKKAISDVHKTPISLSTSAIYNNNNNDNKDFI